jgi:hypothetical protein
MKVTAAMRGNNTSAKALNTPTEGLLPAVGLVGASYVLPKNIDAAINRARGQFKLIGNLSVDEAMFELRGPPDTAHLLKQP